MTNYASHIPVPASTLQSVADITDLLTSGWTTWSPGWTASGANPAIVDGTLTGAFKQVGKTVWCTGIMTAGAGTTFGTGTWRIGWPVTPSLLSGSTGGMISSLYCLDTSLTAQYVGLLVSIAGPNLNLITSPTTVTANVVTATIPFTWAVGDRFTWSMTYEAA